MPTSELAAGPPTRRSLALIMLTMGLAGGAQAQPYPPPNFPPVPALRVEAAPPPPRNPRHVWQTGHWRWSGRDYEWVSGRYVAHRRNTTHFVEGHWIVRHNDWAWAPAHWE